METDPTLRFRYRFVKGLDWHPIHEPDQHFTAAWLEQPITEDWTACLRLAIEDGQPIVSELRVIPSETRHTDDPYVDYEAGEWTVEQLGPAAPVPRGGIGSQLVRRIPFAALDALPEIIAWIADNRPSSMSTLQEAGLQVGTRGKRPGPKGHSDTDLALLSHRYWTLVTSGNPRPNKVLAGEENVTKEAIRDRIQAARDRGLLTSPPKSGKPGGHLTPRAMKLIEAAGSEDGR